jgi:hypothetical protein
MNDPTFPPEAYILACDVLQHITQNLAIQFQMEGESWNRETMQKHVDKRSALIVAADMVLAEGERITKQQA